MLAYVSRLGEALGGRVATGGVVGLTRPGSVAELHLELSVPLHPALVRRRRPQR